MNKTQKSFKTKPIIGEITKTADFYAKEFTVLDSNIPYFIFLDTATASQTEESTSFRTEFDFYLSKNISENGHEIPIVTLVLGGAEGTLSTITRSIDKHRIPCIFVESCRKCSKLFSFFLQNQYFKNQEIPNELIMEKIIEFIDANSELDKEKIQKQISNLLKPKNRDYISILSENERLDTAIISALSNGKNEKQHLHDLSLALTWNRIDLAKNNLGNATHINLVRIKHI